MPSAALLALVVIVLGGLLLARGAEVRLVLVAAALPLYLATGPLIDMVHTAVREMSNPGTIVPIGSAVGFAYVLGVTGCDQHLVHLLLLPARRVRALLIPGGIVAAYVANSAIVSQTGTAAVLGPILIPLLRAGGISPVTAGALLLLGASMGGELFNPGAVEIRTLGGLVGRSSTTVVAGMGPLNLMAGATSLIVFWILASRYERHVLQANQAARATGQGDELSPADHAAAETPPAEPKPEPPFRISLPRALVPLLPLVLLFTAAALPARYAPTNLTGPARILVAMLIGVAAAGLANRARANQLSSAFFEGAGFAYTRIISLIVTATLFAEGVQRSGLVQMLTQGLGRWPLLAVLVTLALPWALAVVSGTGIGSAVTIMKILVPQAGRFGLDPLHLGALIALGSHYGRTMSPVAAVVLMCATLTKTRPADLIGRVVWPLLAGGAVLYVAARLSAIG